MARPAVSALAMVAAAAWAACARPAAAQLVEEVRVGVENDNFNFWLPIQQRGDHEYTHGTAVRVTTRSAPFWGRRFAADTPLCGGEAPGGRCLLSAWEVGQQIYTPRIDAEEPVPGQRPHAGWLYAAATAIAQREQDRHRVRLEVGVTGPPSLAASVHRLVHRLGGYWEPRGWENQLPFEPGVLARYDYSLRLAEVAAGGVRVAELSGTAGGTLGTVITGADAAADVRLGFAVPASWGGTAAGPVSVYAFGRLQGSGYLRNLFLDGSTVGSSPRVDRLPFVRRHQFGVAARYGRAEFSFGVTTRTREYRTEPSGHRYSSLTVTVRP